MGSFGHADLDGVLGMRLTTPPQSHPPVSSEAMGPDEAMAIIANLAARDGPQLDEYAMLWDACVAFGRAKDSGRISEAEHKAFMVSLGPAGTPESLMGHIYHKPYGYAGDFDIIDKLYTRHVSANPRITRWDEFVQRVPSSDSVRNRGPYLRDLLARMVMRRLAGEAGSRPVHLVSLGSGPGRDVRCALDGLSQPDRVRVTCVDTDARALAHSERVLADYDGAVKFIRADAMRFRAEEHADLIWSSGLFDYFADRTFVAVLRRAMTRVVPGGEIVVGNFSDRCPRYGPMSFGGWHLVLRSADALTAAAVAAGADPGSIRVDAESNRLNLFLHVHI